MDLWHVRRLVVDTQVYNLSILGEYGATVARIRTIYAFLGNQGHSGTATYFGEVFVVSFDLQVCG